MSAAQRRRGNRAEVAVVNYLRGQGWPDARRYLAGDGRQPGDIDWHPLVCLEVKDVKRSSWPTWCRQAAAEARPGMVPVVVRRMRGVTDVGEWECRAPGTAMSEAFGPAITNAAVSATKIDGYSLWQMVDDAPWLTCWTMAGLVAAVKAVDA